MKLAIVGAAVAIVFMSSCRSREPREVVIEHERAPPPQTVVIEKTHTHGPGCGHYYYDGHWYAEPEHVHIVRVE